MRSLVVIALLCGVALAQRTTDGRPPHHGNPDHRPPGEEPPPLGPSNPEQPLIRCKRPMMCKMLCPYGFATDAQGCPKCDCLSNPCETKDCGEGKVCRPRTCLDHPCLSMETECHDTHYKCLMRKCVPCEHGYRHDEHGCQTCQCREPEFPCAMPMCADNCPAGYAVDHRGCQTCTCKKPAPIKQCPLAMCAMFCEHGFDQDENGCDMCGCRDAPKEDKCKCPVGHTCRNSENECEPISTCESLRHIVSRPELVDKRLPKVSGFQQLMQKFQKPPVCNNDGSFSPVQCDRPGGECWCVNDRGDKMPENRIPNREGSLDRDREDSERSDERDSSKSHHDKDSGKSHHDRDSGKSHREGSHGIDDMKKKMPKCDFERTIMMKIAFNLMHELEDDLKEHISKIKDLMHEHIGRWMGVKRETITIVKIMPHETLIKVLRVQVVVTFDGHTDLPSAFHRLQAAAHDGAAIPYHHSFLKLQPDSLHADHHTKTYPHLPHEAIHMRPTTCFGHIRHWAHHHKTMMIIAPILGLIILVVITATCCVLCKRRRSARAQFAHKRLENMETFKQNLQLEFDHPDMKGEKAGVTILSAEEKPPIA